MRGVDVGPHFLVLAPALFKAQHTNPQAPLYLFKENVAENAT